MAEPPSPPPRRPRRTAVFVGLGAVALLAAGGLLWLWVAPAEVAAPPPTADELPPAPDLPASELNLPVFLDVGALLEGFETTVPTTFGDLDDERTHPNMDELRYAFAVERSPFDLELRGDTLRLTSELRYQARGGITAPFGRMSGRCPTGDDPAPRAVVALSAPLELDADWTLRAPVRLDRLAPRTDERRDRCVMTSMQFDITDLLLELARMELEDWLGGAGAALARFDLAAELEPHWQILREPIAVGPDTWLALDPQAVRLGGIRAEGEGDRTIRADLAVGLRPRVTVGHRPEVAGGALPPLDRGETGEGSTLLVEGRVGWDAVSELAATGLEGQSFEVGRRTLHVRRVEVAPARGGRISLGLDVDGAAEGRIFLVGTPTYDAATNRVEIPDLDFHVETRNVIGRVGGWLLQAGFPERLRRHARWDVDALVGDVRRTAEESLNRQLSPEVRMEGIVDSLAVDGTHVAREGLVVHSRLWGATRLIVEPRVPMARGAAGNHP